MNSPELTFVYALLNVLLLAIYLWVIGSGVIWLVSRCRRFSLRALLMTMTAAAIAMGLIASLFQIRT